MILYTLVGEGAGQVKEWDAYGARHALDTRFAREATPDEVEQYQLRQAALRATTQAPQAETPEQPARPDVDHQ